MVDKLGSLLTALVLVILGIALALLTLRFLMGIGPIWTIIAVGVGVGIWKTASSRQ